MAFTTPRTWTAGEVLTAAQMNQDVRDNVAFLANPPACRVYHSTTQSTTSAVELALAFNSERYDTASLHDTVTNNSRLVAPVAGLYVITGHFVFAAPGAVGNWRGQAQIMVNGTDIIAVDEKIGVSSLSSYLMVATAYKLAANDYVQLRAFQATGAALNVLATSRYSPEFSMTWVGLG